MSRIYIYLKHFEKQQALQHQSYFVVEQQKVLLNFSSKSAAPKALIGQK